jgi:hypothetical protein
MLVILLLFPALVNLIVTMVWQEWPKRTINKYHISARRTTRSGAASFGDDIIVECFGESGDKYAIPGVPKEKSINKYDLRPNRDDNS